MVLSPVDVGREGGSLRVSAKSPDRSLKQALLGPLSSVAFLHPAVPHLGSEAAWKARKPVVITTEPQTYLLARGLAELDPSSRSRLAFPVRHPAPRHSIPSISTTSSPSLFSGIVGSVMVTVSSASRRHFSRQPEHVAGAIPQRPAVEVHFGAGALRMTTCSLPSSLPAGLGSSAAISTPLGTSCRLDSGSSAVRCSFRHSHGGIGLGIGPQSALRLPCFRLQSCERLVLRVLAEPRSIALAPPMLHICPDNSGASGKSIRMPQRKDSRKIQLSVAAL